MKKLFNRIVSIALSFTLALSCAVCSYAVTIDYGDVNFDNVINSLDALTVLEYSVGKHSLNRFAFEKADVNLDNVVNSNDALDILMYSVGIKKEFDADSSPYLTNEVKNNLKWIKSSADASGKSVYISYNPDTTEYVVINKEGIDTGLLGYRYSVKDKIFYTAENSWQKNFGFNEVYDSAASVGFDTYNTLRVYFEYDGIDWLIQFWKGQYGSVFVGSEIGVYNRQKGSGSGSTHYKCADGDHRLYMTMNVYRQDPDNANKYNIVFERSRSKTWWCTGFVPGTLAFGKINVPDEDGTAKLKVDSKIEFYDEEMAQAFVEGLKNVKYLENNAVLAGTKRSVMFAECSDEAEYEECASSNKFCLCANGTDVRICYR